MPIRQIWRPDDLRGACEFYTATPPHTPPSATKNDLRGACEFCTSTHAGTHRRRPARRLCVLHIPPPAEPPYQVSCGAAAFCTTSKSRRRSSILRLYTERARWSTRQPLTVGRLTPKSAGSCRPAFRAGAQFFFNNSTRPKKGSVGRSRYESVPTAK